MAGVLFLTGCLGAQSEKALPISSAKASAPETIEVQIDELPKDYFFIQGEDAKLIDESGEVIRPLFFQERVFLVRKGVQRSFVEDYAGNQGYVDRSYLSKSFSSYISNEYEGVEYGMYAEKNRPYREYVPVRAVYMPGLQLKNVDVFLDRLEGSVINTVVIDYKDDYDQILFPSKAVDETLPDASYPLLDNPEEFIAKFKERGLRLIARIVVFKSNQYASQYPDQSVVDSSGDLFYSDEGYWVSPHSRQMWQYIVKLSNEALAYGFDEIQYDYVRFPVSYGTVIDLRSPEGENRVAAIQKFIMYAQNNLNDRNALIGSDIFGWSAVSITDEGIGQHWEAMSAVSDIICPMLYPSLYTSGNLGLDRPWREPYEVIKRSTEYALERNANIQTPGLIRPWLQAYDAFIDFNEEEVAEQVRALHDLGIYEYMLWNPDGHYKLGGLNDLQKDRPASP